MRFSQAYSPGRALKASWNMMKAAPAAMLIGGILIMMTSGGGGGGNSFSGDGSGFGESSPSGAEVALIAGVVVFMIALAIGLWLFGCLVRVGFATAAEEVLSVGKARVGLLFDARGLWLRMVLGTLLQALIGIASMIPILVVVLIIALVMGVTEVRGAEGVTIAVVLLLVLLYLPVIFYVTLGASLIPQAVAIEGLRPMEALKRSWELVAGHRLELFIYYLFLGLFSMLGLLACCIGVFVTGTLFQIATYESYLRLVRSDEEQAKWVMPRG